MAVKIYTDGSCSTLGHRAGGWTAVIEYDDSNHEIICDGQVDTTISRMEMTAIIEAIRRTKEKSGPGTECHVFTDSQFVALCCAGEYKRKANRDLWAEYDRVADGMEILVQHVRRNVHSSQALCDQISGRVREALEKNPERKVQCRAGT